MLERIYYYWVITWLESNLMAVIYNTDRIASMGLIN